MEGTKGTEKTKGEGGMYGVDLARGKDRSLTVILCSDEFCIGVGRYRLADKREVGKSRLPYLCEACYKKLSAASKQYYKEMVDGNPPLILNENKDCAGCGCSGCGPHPRGQGDEML